MPWIFSGNSSGSNATHLPSIQTRHCLQLRIDSAELQAEYKHHRTAYERDLNFCDPAAAGTIVGRTELATFFMLHLLLARNIQRSRDGVTAASDQRLLLRRKVSGLACYPWPALVVALLPNVLPDPVAVQSVKHKFERGYARCIRASSLAEESLNLPRNSELCLSGSAFPFPFSPTSPSLYLETSAGAENAFRLFGCCAWCTFGMTPPCVPFG